LPPPAVHQEILTALTADDTQDEASYNLLTQLDLAMMPDKPEDSAVDDFAMALFHSLEYMHRPRAIRTRKELRFFTCGEVKYAKPDVCIINRDANDIILLVQEDKHFGGEIEAHPQLIAEAIAVF
jgi:Uma2 family endonuclease